MPTLVANPTIGWLVQAVSSNDVVICTVCGGNNVGSPGPEQLLIGDPDPNSANHLYTNANGSINQNSAHNPFLLASGTDVLGGLSNYTGSSPQWTISIPRMTSTSMVTAVTFGFGTTLGDDLTLAPEPASWALLAIGILSICVVRVRFVKKGGVVVKR